MTPFFISQGDQFQEDYDILRLNGTVSHNMSIADNIAYCNMQYSIVLHVFSELLASTGPRSGISLYFLTKWGMSKGISKESSTKPEGWPFFWEANW